MTGAPEQALAVAFAIIGALSYALASVHQQQSASQLQSSVSFDPVVLLRLVRSRRWLLSMIAVICGYGLQAAALDLGRLVIVEPVFPVALLFALLLAARAEGRRLRHAEWTATLAAIAGLGVFLVAAQPSGGQRTASAGPLGLTAAGAVVVAVLCCLIAVKVSAPRRALVLSVGGGVGAGVTDALTKTVAALAGTHRFGIFGDVRLYLLAVVGLLAFTMQQNAFRAAGLPASLPAFAVLEPVVGSILGLAIYEERVGSGGIRIAVEALAVLAAIWGIARLANLVIAELARLAAAASPPADPAA
ncbi:MAG TPA: DMT family transporter [Streptosporangiaceae bacterium]|nr:DMT family transporter [Streptosporangiaceae bacterium]